jgi:hypothetical protein
MQLSTCTGRKKLGLVATQREFIESQSAGRNETVQVRMMSQVLRPGVQYRKRADACPQMPRIGGDLQQGLRSRAEQQVIKDALVTQRERRQLLGHGEDDMRVGHRQQA